jgi:hypothetical protein
MPAGMAKGVVIRTAANESEAVQLVVRPAVPLEDVHVSCDGLACGNRSLPPPAIDILRVGYVDIKRPTDYAGGCALWPDPLPEQDGTLPVKAGENQPFWIRVKPPRGTARGVYRGELRVRCDVAGGEARNISVPISVEVFGFDMPDKMTCETAFGVEMSMVERYHRVHDAAQRQKVFDLYLDALASHHISPYNPTPYAKWSVRWNGLGDSPLSAIPVFDWTAWDKEMSRVMSEYGFNTYELKLEGLGGGDYEYLAILKRLIAVRRDSLAPEEVQACEKLLEVPSTISASMTSFTMAPEPIEDHRLKVARMIEKLVGQTGKPAVAE